MTEQKLKFYQNLEKNLNLALDQALEKAQRSIAAKKNSNQIPQNIESILKNKDKEISNQETVIQNLRREVQQYKVKFVNEGKVDRFEDQDSQLKEAEKKNQELVREIKVLQKIQNDQSKALEKLTNQNEYALKLKGLMDQLKASKEQCKELKDKQRKDENQLKTQQEQMIRLEEKCKELKAINSQGNQQKPKKEDQTIDQNQYIGSLLTKIQELEKSKEMLDKQKDIEIKKKKKIIKEQKVNIQDLTIQIEECYKQLKELHQEKLIAGSKLKEVQMSIKHNQLTPLRGIPNTSNNIKVNVNGELEKDIRLKYNIDQNNKSKKVHSISGDYDKNINDIAQSKKYLKRNMKNINNSNRYIPQTIQNSPKGIGLINNNSFEIQNNNISNPKIENQQELKDQKQNIQKVGDSIQKTHDFYSYDESDFEKRYGQKLYKEDNNQISNNQKNHNEQNNLNQNQNINLKNNQIGVNNYNHYGEKSNLNNVNGNY